MSSWDSIETEGTAVFRIVGQLLEEWVWPETCVEGAAKGADLLWERKWRGEEVKGYEDEWFVVYHKTGDSTLRVRMGDEKDRQSSRNPCSAFPSDVRFCLTQDVHVSIYVNFIEELSFLFGGRKEKSSSTL